jgi:hypothetical protein
MRMVKTSRVLALAAVAVLAVPGVSLAASHSSAQPSSPRHAAAAAPHKLTPRQTRLLRAVMGKFGVKAFQNKVVGTGLKPRAAIGNFSQCPKLPTGDDPASSTCGLIHITGGVLDIGASHQIINREITISFGEFNDPSGNTIFIHGTTRSEPMPVLGGIFETPEVNKATSADKNLQLHVQPVQTNQALDTAGTGGLVIVSQRVKAISPVFGKNCSIGTRQDPIVLDPTLGTTNPPPPNMPESGHADALEIVGSEIVAFATVVDNAFAAPAATGCGPPGALDANGALNRVVNLVGGFPSAAGNNNAVFQVTVEAVAYSSI